MSTVVQRFFLPALGGLLVAFACQPSPCVAQEPGKAAPRPAADATPEAPEGDDQDRPKNAPAPHDLTPPDPVPEEKLAPTLETVPVRRDRRMYNYQMVDTSLLPRDKEGIWVLDFSFKPLRIRTVEVPGKGRRVIHYLYYKVVNRTGKPRMFAPQFIMVNEEGKRFEDEVVPQAIPVIRAREDQTIPVRGAVDVIGEIPPSTKEGVDDAVFGVAAWDRWDPKSDRFSIYVRGLSDGYKEVPNPSGGKPTVKYKTLRIDFIRRGDERNLSEKEIELSDPPYEWVYW